MIITCSSQTANLFLVLTADYFPLSSGHCVQISLSSCLHGKQLPPKERRSVAVITHRSTVVFVPSVIMYVIRSCGSDTEQNSLPPNSQTKQARLTSERVAPKHIGHVERSKTHYRFGHKLEIETYFTPGLWQQTPAQMHFGSLESPKGEAVLSPL